MKNFKDLCETYVDLQSTVNKIKSLSKENQTNQFLAILEMHHVLYCVIKGKIFNELHHADMPRNDRMHLIEQIELLEKEGLKFEHKEFTSEKFSMDELFAGNELEKLIKAQQDAEKDLGMEPGGVEIWRGKVSPPVRP